MLAVEYALPVVVVVVWLGRRKFEEFSAQRVRTEKQLSGTVWVCVRGVLQRTTGAFLPSKKKRKKKKEKKSVAQFTQPTNGIKHTDCGEWMKRRIPVRAL